MEDFIKFLITPLLSSTEELVITQTGNIVTLKVGDADVGRIIGKKGNVINALRTLVRTYGTINHLPIVNLQLQTPLKKD
jgi:predicted RNA-binding protein YlqC (UPF0109 family)